MSELYRVLVTRPNGKKSLATNNSKASRHCGSKYFSKQLAEHYVMHANLLAADRGSEQTFKVLADGEGFYTL